MVIEPQILDFVKKVRVRQDRTLHPQERRIAGADGKPLRHPLKPVECAGSFALVKYRPVAEHGVGGVANHFPKHRIALTARIEVVGKYDVKDDYLGPHFGEVIDKVAVDVLFQWPSIVLEELFVHPDNRHVVRNRRPVCPTRPVIGKPPFQHTDRREREEHESCRKRHCRGDRQTDKPPFPSRQVSPFASHGYSSNQHSRSIILAIWSGSAPRIPPKGITIGGCLSARVPVEVSVVVPAALVPVDDSVELPATVPPPVESTRLRISSLSRRRLTAFCRSISCSPAALRSPASSRLIPRVLART